MYLYHMFCTIIDSAVTMRTKKRKIKAMVG